VETPFDVLVAEDSPSYRYVLEREIARHPRLRLVRGTDDGSDAVALVCRLQPDIAVVDLHMPGRDGLEVARAVQAARPAPRTTLVLLTTSPTPDLERSADRAGFACCLSKERSPAEIVAALARIAEGARESRFTRSQDPTRPPG
jgi:DNA-binding NarL/FixJ family response regulator